MLWEWVLWEWLLWEREWEWVLDVITWTSTLGLFVLAVYRCTLHSCRCESPNFIILPASTEVSSLCVYGLFG